MKWEIIKKFFVENNICFSNKEVIAEYPDKDQSYPFGTGSYLTGEGWW